MVFNEGGILVDDLGSVLTLGAFEVDDGVGAFRDEGVDFWFGGSHVGCFVG